jgi:hypothetical protein
MGWAQRRKNRVDRHREHLLAESQALLETELSSFSARGASPVTSDAELDSPASLAAQDFPDVQDACGQDSPVVQVAHDRKRRRDVTVQDYPWKFVSPQLLDRNGREILYPVEDDRDRWWARKMECAINYHRDVGERDLDGLQAYSLEIVKRVQQKMAKEKCCFCLARNEHNNMLSQFAQN